jgi:hypothetical protein
MSLGACKIGISSSVRYESKVVEGQQDPVKFCMITEKYLRDGKILKLSTMIGFGSKAPDIAIITVIIHGDKIGTIIVDFFNIWLVLYSSPATLRVASCPGIFICLTDAKNLDQSS